MTEQWRDIVGFEGRYEVSRDGQIRNARSGRVLKGNVFPNGYVGVMLGQGRRYLVHRLVAAAFVEGDTNLQVNHKSGNRADNRAENLEWLSCSDNHRHSYAELNRKQHSLTQPVVVGGVRYESELAAAKVLGVVAGSVRSALKRGHRCKGMGVAYG